MSVHPLAIHRSLPLQKQVFNTHTLQMQKEGEDFTSIRKLYPSCRILIPLKHKFRYRDGRNRNTGSAGSTTHRKRRSHVNDSAFGGHDYQPVEGSRHSSSAEEGADGNAYRADMRSNYTKNVAFFDQTGSMSSGMQAPRFPTIRPYEYLSFARLHSILCFVPA